MWGNVRIFYHLCSIRVGLRLHKTFLYDKTLVLLWEIILIIPHALRETKKVFCRNIYFFHLYICVCVGFSFESGLKEPYRNVLAIN